MHLPVDRLGVHLQAGQERQRPLRREEGLTEGALSDYYRALDALAGWSHYHSYERPHTALKYLCPVDYYRGDREARLAERERKLVQAAEARKAYWAGVGSC